MMNRSLLAVLRKLGEDYDLKAALKLPTPRRIEYIRRHYTLEAAEAFFSRQREGINILTEPVRTKKLVRLFDQEMREHHSGEARKTAALMAEPEREVSLMKVLAADMFAGKNVTAARYVSAGRTAKLLRGKNRILWLQAVVTKLTATGQYLEAARLVRSLPEKFQSSSYEVLLNLSMADTNDFGDARDIADVILGEDDGV